MPTIYLSSTYEDLKDHRRVVFEALRQSGFQVIAMEDYVAREDRPVKACLSDVVRADIYVGLFAFRYGFVPPAEHGNPEGRSITELEFRHAEASSNTRCLVFLLDEKVPWSNAFNDSWTGEGEGGTCIRRLREELSREKMGGFFSTPYELATKVQSAVSACLVTQSTTPYQSAIQPEAITWDVAKQGSPYPGLMHFTRRFAPVFFGRELEVRELLDRLTLPEGRFLIVSGDSGSGKSSLVDAGVLSRLEEGLPGGNGSLRIVRMVPSGGADPFDALMRALRPVTERSGLDDYQLGHDLADGQAEPSDVLRDVLTRDLEADRLFLFLDQMEELFTAQDKNPALVTRFLSGLYAATQNLPLQILATICSDRLNHCFTHPEMLAVLSGRGHYALGRMAAYNLYDMIVQPARCAGVSVPEPLSRRLVEDVGAEPGNLPLLAYVLQQLFDQRKNDTLSEATYEAMGGMTGAIARHVGEVEQSLATSLELDREQLVQPLEDLFESLVRVDIEGLPTRRSVQRTTLPDALEPVVEALVKERLLTTEGEGAASRVSVAHVHLFEAWPVFSLWLKERQSDLRMLSMAEIDAGEWKLQNYDPAYLWSSDRAQKLRGIIQRLSHREVIPVVKRFAYRSREAVAEKTFIKKPTDIFISYVYDNREHAQILTNALESNGWSIYLPKVTSSNRVWNDTDAIALDKSRCVLVIWSLSSINIELLINEANEARERGILVSVLLDDVSIPNELQNFRRVDLPLRGITDKRPSSQSLIDSISRLIGDPPRVLTEKRIREAQTHNITQLNLSNLDIETWPHSLRDLELIQELDLSRNKLKSLPQSFNKIRQLKKLDLSNNLLTWLPDSLDQLTNLETLDLHGNKLTWLPQSIKHLTKLNTLDVSDNHLKSLPTSLSKLKLLTTINLRGNDLLGIPLDLLNPPSTDKSNNLSNTKQTKELLTYYFKTRSAPRPLNEAKLILVGDGRVGKTSIVNRLVNDTFDEKENKTEGIEITEWLVKTLEGEEVHLHIWDFGGQEIMHSTHQFFLTEPSLYLLVLKGRQGHEELDAEYWLNMVHTYGGDSPVILVLNKISEHKCNINRRGFTNKFPNIRGFVETDCADRTGIDQLRGSIQQAVDHLDHIHDSFPSNWCLKENPRFFNNPTILIQLNPEISTVGATGFYNSLR